MADPPLSCTPLPIPRHFRDAEAPFSSRRRGPPRLGSQTPRPPAKAGAHASRVFPGGERQSWSRSRPQSVTGGEAGPGPPHSGVYDSSKRQPFFEQCFEMIAHLGSGSFGDVFKVRSRDDGRLYAVKRSVDRYRGAADRARRLYEARGRAALGGHRNLLGLWGAWEEGGRLYLQTELCGGTLLEAAAAPRALPEARVWAALSDALGGLKHLHDRRAAHMDVKPANVFIGPLGEHKLGDFGLLLPLAGRDEWERGPGGTVPRRDERDTGPAGTVPRQDEQEGDPRYMAPELLHGVYTTAADVFSLGITILEICSDLDIPQCGEGWQKLRQGYLPTEFLTGASPELLEVLRAMLNPDHRQRASVDELLAMPAVRRARRWRRGQLAARCVLEWALNICQYLLSVLARLCRGVFLPLFGLFLPLSPPPPASPPPSAANGSGLYSDWTDTSLTDDVFTLSPSHPGLELSDTSGSLGTTSTPRYLTREEHSGKRSDTSGSLGTTSTPRYLTREEHSGKRRPSLRSSPNVSLIGRDSPTLTPPPQDSLCLPSPTGDPLSGRGNFEPRNLLSLFEESM